MPLNGNHHFHRIICEYALLRGSRKTHSGLPAYLLGIDINVTSGPCVVIRSPAPLVNPQTGCFIQTSQRMKDPRWGQDVFKPYEECYREACAQIEKFRTLVKKNPEYLQSHSTSGSHTYLKAIRDAAHHYHIPFSYEVREKYSIRCLMPPTEGDPYSFANQTLDRIALMLDQLEAHRQDEYVCLPSHCGFVDAELMRLSRCNLARAYDHAYLTSPKIKAWIEDHHAQLISYRDLPMDE
ncbi:MAG: ChbG/HpnK family deacetylase [Holdemania massiliensis]